MTRDIFESVIDVGSGFILAVLIQLLIFPLFDLHPSIFDSMGIALIFTVVSMVASSESVTSFPAKSDACAVTVILPSLQVDKSTVVWNDKSFSTSAVTVMVSLFAPTKVKVTVWPTSILVTLPCSTN